MKTTGIVLLVFGALAFMGNMIGGSNPTGALFFIVLGAYLIHRANQKKKEKEDKDKWANQ